MSQRIVQGHVLIAVPVVREWKALFQGLCTLTDQKAKMRVPSDPDVGVIGSGERGKDPGGGRYL